MDDGWDDSGLDARHRAALALADAYLGAGGPPSPATQERIRGELTGEEITELVVGLALFHGFSKLLIATGCEPDEMDTTVLPTPDVPRPR